MTRSAAEIEGFRRVAAEVYALHAAGRYAEALAAAARAAARFPDRSGPVAYWIACLRSVSGDPDGALAVLEAASAAGHWWSEHWLHGDPDLAALQDRPEFEAVVAQSNRRRRAAQAEAEPRLFTTPPVGAARALLVALHGASWLGEDFAPHWTPAAAAGVAVAVPQSSQRSSEEGYGWEDEPLAEREVAGAAASARRALRLPDSVPTVLGGFSQGGRLAVAWALRDAPVGLVRGFVAMAPGIRDAAAMTASAGDLADRGLRGVLLSGTADLVLAETRALHGQLTGRGVACRLEVIDGLAHEFPEDFAERLLAALDFLLG